MKRFAILAGLLALLLYCVPVLRSTPTVVPCSAPYSQYQPFRVIGFVRSRSTPSDDGMVSSFVVRNYAHKIQVLHPNPETSKALRIGAEVAVVGRYCESRYFAESATRITR